MKRRVSRKLFLLTFVLPLAHLALCIAIERNVITFDGWWPFLMVVDFPASFLLFGLAFRDDHFMLWFGVFGTLWSYGVSWAAWAAWSLYRASASPASEPPARP